MSRRIPRALRRRFGAAGTIAAIVAFTLLAGTGASYAYWSATTSTAATATTGDVAVTVSNFAPAALTNHGPSTTGSVTVTNTTVQNPGSTTAATLSLVFSRSGGTSSGSAAFANATTLVVWPTASAANCTAAATPTGGTTGTWGGSGLTVTGTLAKGAAQIYCVRTSLATPSAAGVSSGTNDFQAQVAATLSVGNFTGSASVAPSETTAYIYPLGTTATGSYQAIYVGNGTALCADVENATTTTGSELIPWGCHGGTNQQWRFTATVAGYYEINPGHATGLRIGATATASGSAVTVQTDSTASAQDWQLQTISGGIFQFVNRASGFCLTSSSTTGDNNSPMTVEPCNGSVAQRFQPASGAPLVNLQCTAGTGGLNRNLTLTWTSLTGTFTLWIDGTATSTSSSGTTTGMTRTIGLGDYTIGSHTYTVVNGSGSQVGSGTFTMGNFIGSGILTGCTP